MKNYLPRTNKIRDMKTMFLVTHGEYSDYGIGGVFDNKDLAEAYITMFGDGDSQIEEFELNPFKKEMRKGLKPYSLQMTKEGNCFGVHVTSKVYYLIGETKYFFDGANNMQLYTMAKDEKHAIKIANEKRGQLIALNQWGRK